MLKFVKGSFNYLIHFVKRPWFPLLVSFLAAADIFIFIVPNDIFVISAVLARPKYWLSTALVVALGSFLGAATLAGLSYYDSQWVIDSFPQVFASQGWQETADFLKKYGFAATFLGSVGPIPLQPFVFVGALSDMPTWALLGGTLTGRVTKYVAISYIAAKSPELLNRIFRVRVPESVKQEIKRENLP